MKKLLMLISAVILAACVLCACGNAADNTTANNDNDQITIVTTIFPEYDWVMNVLGDNPGNAEVTMLLDNGVDLHSYQPTADDILKISNCDMFIYVGGESDEWVEDALDQAVNKDMVVIDLLDCLGDNVKEEELVEGMQGEDEEDEHHHEDGEEDEDEDEEGHHHDEEEGPEYDEHVWLSLKNAAILTDCIKAGICQIDEANKDTYEANASAYIEKLGNLDSEYSAAASAASVKTVLFGDRFPFRYLTDDYGLTYYAAFIGCSAETEASFETITFLAEKVDELSLSCVLTIESSDGSIAETIIENTKNKNQNVLTLDSMQSVTAADVSNGASYLAIMESNLEVLKEALN